MKFIAICLLSLIAISSVYADNQAIADCISKLTIPCTGSQASVQCATDFATYNTCLTSKSCLTKVENFSDYADCLKSCKSSNADVQKYIDSIIACNSTLLSFAALMIAIFALFF